MVDHQLLTLAARAAGITLTWPDGLNDHPRVTDKDGAVWIWNPCDFDGDAFRLGVDLNAFDHIWFGIELYDARQVVEGEHAAYRLAITRAAAEIGKTIS
jgi:hypothetical protein